MIIQPARSNISINSGNTVISFDFPSTFFCLRINLYSIANVLTILIGRLSFFLSPEFLDCFPSNAIISYSIFFRIPSIQLMKYF